MLFAASNPRARFFKITSGALRHRAVFAVSWALIASSNPAPASPAWLVENSLPSSITGRLAHAAWKLFRVPADAVMPGRSKIKTRDAHQNQRIAQAAAGVNVISGATQKCGQAYNLQSHEVCKKLRHHAHHSSLQQRITNCVDMFVSRSPL
jgi:hypothetical protein